MYGNISLFWLSPQYPLGLPRLHDTNDSVFNELNIGFVGTWYFVKKTKKGLGKDGVVSAT